MCRAAWRPLLVALASLLGLLYLPVLRDLVRVWTVDSYASHGFVIPLWCAWLAWGALPLVRRLPRHGEPRALAIVAGGLALLALARAGSILTLAALSLPLVLIGLGRFALGHQAFRPLLFPAAFLAFMAPLPAEAIPRLSLPLQQLAAWFTELALAGLSVPATRDGLFVRLPSVVVHVAESCSGLRFLLVMIPLGVAAAWIVERRWPHRLVIFGLAVVAAIGANLVRVAGTVVLVYHYGPAAATGSFHALFGKALYFAALVLFLLAARAVRGSPTTGTAFRTRRDVCAL